MTTSNQVGVPLSGSIGTGGFLGSTSGALVTPVLGTPSAGVLTNCTGLPGASCVFIASQTASNSAELDFNNGAIASYNILFFLYTAVYPATNAANLQLQFSVDNGANFIATGYKSATIYWPAGSVTTASSNSTTGCRIGPAFSSTTSDPALNGYLFIFNMNNGGWPSHTGAINFYSTNTTAMATGMNAGNGGNNPNANSLRVIPSSGNIASGTFTLYGIRESN